MKQASELRILDLLRVEGGRLPHQSLAEALSEPLPQAALLLAPTPVPDLSFSAKHAGECL